MVFMVEAMWKSKMAEKNQIIIIQMWQEIALLQKGCKDARRSITKV